jgi:membrane associated rhomboid family serine protease
MQKLIVEFLDDVVWPMVWVMAMWVAFFYNLAFDLHLNDFGIKPRVVEGLLGILFSPFLHGDFGHLFSNSIPFLVSGAFIYHFFRKEAFILFLLIWAGSGFLTWFWGDYYTNHIGASGMVYGMVFFLLTGGIIRKNRSLAAVALILVFLYGGMIWGIFPQFRIDLTRISWEGHAGGALTGAVLAYVYRKAGPEDDVLPDEEDEEMPQWWTDMQRAEEEKRKMEENSGMNIFYHYRPKQEEKEEDADA